MVMLAPSTAAPCAERPRAGPSWAHLPLERSTRQAPEEDGRYGFSGGARVLGAYLDEVLMMRNAAGTKYYYHANHLYSVHAITNQSGAIVEAVGSYDAYGKPTILTGAGTDATWFTGDDVVGSVSAIGNPFWFQGHRVDAETGLGQWRLRFYDYDQGRFLNRNPWGYIHRFLHLYDCVSNNPVNWLEPLSKEKWAGAVDPENPYRERAMKLWDEIHEYESIYDPWTADYPVSRKRPEAESLDRKGKETQEAYEKLKECCENCPDVAPCAEVPCTKQDCLNEAMLIAIRYTMRVNKINNKNWTGSNSAGGMAGNVFSFLGAGTGCSRWQDEVISAVKRNYKCWEVYRIADKKQTHNWVEAQCVCNKNVRYPLDPWFCAAPVVYVDPTPRPKGHDVQTRSDAKGNE